MTTMTIINEEKSILRNMKGTRTQNCDCVFFVCFVEVYVVTMFLKRRRVL